MTSFEAIDDAEVSSTTQDTPLINPISSPAILSSKDLSADVFQLRFAEIRDGNGTPIGAPGSDGSERTVPARVTFTELSNAASPYGYFARNCNSCHGATNPSGGLNLTSYTAAQLSASTILNR